MPRLALSPLLVAQALAVRKQAQSLPEAEGPREGESGSGPGLRLRIIGDSSAAGVGAAHQSEALLGQVVARLSARHRVSWTLDAITGATTRSTLQRLKERKPEATDVVITALGVNDVTRLVGPRRWVAQQERLIARITALYTPNQIYISGMPPLSHFPLLPNPLRWTLGRQALANDKALQTALKGRAGVSYVPFDLPMDPALIASDGFHPSPKLYSLWADTMVARILADLGSGPINPASSAPIKRYFGGLERAGDSGSVVKRSKPLK